MSSQEFIHISAKTGALLKARREALKISRSEVAEKMNASVQQVEHYEKGDYDIAVDRLFRLSQMLELPMTELLQE